jgi:uncharacterized protein YgiM (DUF1202 family)
MKMTFTLIAASALLLNGALAQAPAPAEPAPATPPPAPVFEPPAVIPAPAAAPEQKAAPAETTKAAPKKAPAKKPTAKKTKPTTPAAPEPPDNPTPATVKGDRVNVRGKASLIGEVVTQLKKGESITVLSEIPVKSPKPGEPAAWAKIAMPANVPVWIHASYVDATTKTVKASRLNVRAGPGENFSVIGRLPSGVAYKELRQIDDWIEIEAPSGTFGYVAADLVAKGAALTATTPAPDLNAATPSAPVETVKVETPPAPATPTDPVVTTPATPATPTVSDPPAPEPFVAPAPVPDAPPIKRIVTREGIVRYSVSLRAPSHFSLEDLDTKRTIAFLITDHKDLNFHHLVHQRYLVTGEEFLDKRWNNRTVLRVDSVEAAP